MILGMLVSGKSHSHVFGCHIVGIWRFHFTRLRKKGLSIVKLMSAVYLESSYIHVTTWICFFKFSLLWVKLIIHRWFVVNKLFFQIFYCCILWSLSFIDLILLFRWQEEYENLRTQAKPTRTGNVCIFYHYQNGPDMFSCYFRVRWHLVSPVLHGQCY